MIFDGHDLGQWVRAKHSRRLLPKISDTTVTVPGRDGSIFVRSQLKPLVIPATIRLIAPPCSSQASALIWREIASIIMTDDVRPLILPEEPHLHYLAKLTNAGDLDSLWYTGSCDIEFTAYDPVAFGKTRTIELTPGETEIEIGGTYKTFPVFDLRPRAGMNNAVLLIRNEDTGAYVKSSSGLPANASIEVDMADETFRVNSNLVKVVIQSDYFPLYPGKNHVTISTLYNGTMTWTERWL